MKMQCKQVDNDPGIEDIVEDEENFPPEECEPSDLEMMASFGTMWHDWL